MEAEENQLETEKEMEEKQLQRGAKLQPEKLGAQVELEKL